MAHRICFLYSAVNINLLCKCITYKIGHKYNRETIDWSGNLLRCRLWRHHLNVNSESDTLIGSVKIVFWSSCVGSLFLTNFSLSSWGLFHSFSGTVCYSSTRIILYIFSGVCATRHNDNDNQFISPLGMKLRSQTPYSFDRCENEIHFAVNVVNQMLWISMRENVAHEMLMSVVLNAVCNCYAFLHRGSTGVLPRRTPNSNSTWYKHLIL